MLQVKVFEFNMLPVNTYVLWDETLEACIIDPGCYWPGESDALDEFILANHLNVKLLLNTHLHFDHIFGNPHVENRYGVRTHAGEQDLPWMTDFKRRTRLFGLDCDITFNPLLPENYLHEGDALRFGNTTFEVLHVPGHSPGSMVFYSRQDKMLFTGDVLFQNGRGRTDFMDGDCAALESGITGKLFTLPEETVVWPGHGPATTIGAERDRK